MSNICASQLSLSTASLFSPGSVSVSVHPHSHLGQSQAQATASQSSVAAAAALAALTANRVLSGQQYPHAQMNEARDVCVLSIRI